MCIWHLFDNTFPSKLACSKHFLLGVGTALAHLLEAVEKEPCFSVRQELQGHLESCGDVTSAPLGWGSRKSSGVQGWRGDVGVAGAHRGALQGGHLLLCVEEDDGPWGSYSHWEQAPAGVEHDLQQQQGSCCILKLHYPSYLLGSVLSKGCHRSLTCEGCKNREDLYDFQIPVLKKKSVPQFPISQFLLPVSGHSGDVMSYFTSILPICNTGGRVACCTSVGGGGGLACSWQFWLGIQQGD